MEFIERNRTGRSSSTFPHTMPGQPRIRSPARRFAASRPTAPTATAIEELDWSAGEILTALQATRPRRQHARHLDQRQRRGAAQSAAGQQRALPGQGYTPARAAMRMPCIMRWPGKVPAGTRVRRIVHDDGSAADACAARRRAAAAAQRSTATTSRPLLFGEPGAKSP